MRRDIAGRVAGDGLIARWQFRDAAEVQDQGFVINGSGITFPGDGVRFTRTPGQRLVLERYPARATMLTAFSGHCVITPDFAKDAAGTYNIWTGDWPASPSANGGSLYIYPTSATSLYSTIAGSSFGPNALQAAVRAQWRDFARNYISWSVRDSEQLLWMNGVLIGSLTAVKPLPATTSKDPFSLVIGAGGAGVSYSSVFHGTIHRIDWYERTMTAEEHADLMQADTYSEIWGASSNLADSFPLAFTTTKQTQSWTIRAQAGETFTFDWGDGTTTIATATSSDQTFTKDYGSAGTRTIRFAMARPDRLYKLNCASNDLVGPLPSLAACTELQYFGCNSNKLSGQFPSMDNCRQLTHLYCGSNAFSGPLPSFANCKLLQVFSCQTAGFSGPLPSFENCDQLQLFHAYANAFSGPLPSFEKCLPLNDFRIYSNAFSGPMPSFAKCVSLVHFVAYTNSFTGSLPSFNSCPQLQTFRIEGSGVSGTLPSFANCSALVDFRVSNNNIDSYTPFAFPNTCTYITFANCLLPSSDVSRIVTDVATGLGSRPTTGTLSVQGALMGTPTGQALVDQDTILDYGWTVITNALPSSIPNTLLWQGEYSDSRATFNTQPVVVNGTFAGDFGWVKEANWTIQDGKATHAPGVASRIQQSPGQVVGNRYEVTWDLTLRSGTAYSQVGGTSAPAKSVSGTYTDDVTCAGTTMRLGTLDAGSDFDVDNVSSRNISITSYRPAFVGSSYGSTVLQQPGPAYMSWKSSDGLGLRYEAGDRNQWSAAPSASKGLHDGSGATLLVAASFSNLSAWMTLATTAVPVNTANVGAAIFATANQAQATVMNGSGVMAMSGSIATSVEVGNVYVFALRSAAGVGNVRLAKNGVQIISGTINAPSAADPTTGLNVGSDSTFHTNGVVFDTFLANRILTDVEVRSVGERMFIKAHERSGCTVLGPFTTTKLAQSWIMRVTAGQVYGVVWGDGTYGSYVGTGADQTITHTYAGAGAYTINWYLKPTSVIGFECQNNQLSGSLPSFSAFTEMERFQSYTNTFSGSLPSFAACTKLKLFHAALAGFSGQLPSFGTCTQLQNFRVYNNSFSGQIPSFASCTSLIFWYAYANQFTSYVPQTIAPTCTSWLAHSNALPQASVDAILADIATGIGARPINGVLNLSGGTNAVPSAAGLANKALVAARPWTVTTN